MYCVIYLQGPRSFVGRVGNCPASFWRHYYIRERVLIHRVLYLRGYGIYPRQLAMEKMPKNHILVEKSPHLCQYGDLFPYLLVSFLYYYVLHSQNIKFYDLEPKLVVKNAVS